MPSIYDIAIRATTSPAEKALWAEYFSIIDSLYERRIWAYDYSDEGGFLRPDGTRRPPRLVAVVESDQHWALLVERVAEVEDLKTKWPVQMVDQTWGWGRVQVNQAHHSERLEAGEVLSLLPPVEGAKGGQEGAKKFIAKLEAAGHGGRISEGLVEVRAGSGGLTLRQGAGRAFVLRGWSESGELLGRYSVGVVVLRGCKQGIFESEAAPRKVRKDALVKFGSWESWSFYT